MRSHEDAEDAEGTEVPETPGGLLRESFQVSAPLIAASLSTLALAFADTAIVGRHSTEALATVALVLPVYVFASALIIPWGTAVQVLVARWKGAEDLQRISRMMDVGAVVCVGIGLLVAVPLLLGADLVVELLADDVVPQDAATVLRILALGLPFLALTTQYRGAFGGLKQTRIAMQVALLVAVSNIPLDYLLVLGLDLGAIGSGLATLAATALGAVYITIFGLRRFAATYRYPRRDNLREPGDLVRPLWRIGWPDATFGVIAYGADVVLIAIVAALGSASLAAHRTIAVTVMLLWTVVFSCSSGVAILAGQRLGADDPAGVAAYRRAGAVLMALLATPLLLPALVAPTWFFGLFTEDAAVVAEARSVAPLLVLILGGMLVSMPITGVLRAGGDTRGIMVIGTIAQAGIALPTAYLAVHASDLGLRGVILGLAAGWVARTVLTLLRYRGGAWRRQLEASDAPSASRGRRSAGDG